MLTTEFFSLLDQCCDGKAYLRLGEDCAIEGDCYDVLRPMGAIYWFSLPYRLGLDPDSFVFAHLVLLLISNILFVRWIMLSLDIKAVFGLAATFLFGAAIHVMVFYPLLRVSFADIPAAIFSLIGIWLILASTQHGNKTILYAISGLCFGVAVWVRAFYLYPFLVSLFLWLAYSLWKNKFQSCHLWFFNAALIPIALQFANTYHYSGSFSYIAPEKVEQGVEIHMDDPAVGYDVVVRPKKYVRWNSDCGEINGLITSLKKVDMGSLICLIKGRVYFYFGSYGFKTYPFFRNYDSYWGDYPLPRPAPEHEYRVRDSRTEGISANDIRYWSILYLSVNIAVLAFVIAMVFRQSEQTSDVSLFVAMLVFLLAAEGMLIVPEQRFMVVPLIMLWLYALKVILGIYRGSQEC